ncbi:hypothetical protein F7R21_09865 [Burkholderia latens]|uniref:Uncharacterized protein n=1 Tax=Burkholderia latens TaxID=488446 RepID=A0A6H9TR28_9BURK|nr:hypothetical protein F7R21_09865 [Burkholderia latens]
MHRPHIFRPTNSHGRRIRRRGPLAAAHTAIIPGGPFGTPPGSPPGGPLRPPRTARGRLKRACRRDVKVPATNEATNNPAGRARRSARGRHALASPCRTP